MAFIDNWESDSQSWFYAAHWYFQSKEQELNTVTGNKNLICPEVPEDVGDSNCDK